MTKRPLSLWPRYIDSHRHQLQLPTRLSKYNLDLYTKSANGSWEPELPHRHDQAFHTAPLPKYKVSLAESLPKNDPIRMRCDKLKSSHVGFTVMVFGEAGVFEVTNGGLGFVSAACA